MKLLGKFLPIAILLCFAGSAAYAQSGIDAFFGVGAASDSAAGAISSIITGNTVYPPKITGTFGLVGADIMFTHHLGVGGEEDFRFTQGPYADVKYRPNFFDFYGIWEPIRDKRITPQFEVGVGGANLKFYYPSNYCDQLAGCSSQNQYLESSNHFQVRFGVGVNFYATEHVFIRPQVDVHYVDNFFQFGSDWVPQYTLAVGYRFGSH